MATKNDYYLYPAMLFAEPHPHRVTTVLGSCIAVCLFDPLRRMGGINHYMLPLWNGEGLPTPRYGNVAIDLLVERLEGVGCLPSRLQAKLFGGAAMWESGSSFVSVGERNIELALHMLDRYGIPVVGRDTGGSISRKIIYDTGTGEVLLRRSVSRTPEHGA
ncbi:chemotaxis protein CheD [Geobacter sp. AOG1]|uniref:chemotaxis protein CheD n=1 Tax=Geobacter sp. AOG1 TaxID=1566346 RepID=UPI001CC57E64|nr:chemotaxis protein CheD [Geobacter sp. AOG1]GFE56681.1 putative chemoreceptor glutamine deamidase CheD [Geobacter sp. AOG1]